MIWRRRCSQLSVFVDSKGIYLLPRQLFSSSGDMKGVRFRLCWKRGVGLRSLCLVWCTGHLKCISVTVDGFEQCRDDLRRVPTVLCYLNTWWTFLSNNKDRGLFLKFPLRAGPADYVLVACHSICWDVLIYAYASPFSGACWEMLIQSGKVCRTCWRRTCCQGEWPFNFHTVLRLKLICWGSNGGKWFWRLVVIRRWLAGGLSI